jgi:hypothetical protein
MPFPTASPVMSITGNPAKQTKKDTPSISDRVSGFLEGLNFRDQTLGANDLYRQGSPYA